LNDCSCWSLDIFCRSYNHSKTQRIVRAERIKPNNRIYINCINFTQAAVGLTNHGIPAQQKALDRYMPAFMKVFIVTIFVLDHYDHGQHSDLFGLENNTFILAAYDDDQIIKEGWTPPFLTWVNPKGDWKIFDCCRALAKWMRKQFLARAFAYLQLDNYSKSLNDYNVAIGIDSADYVNLTNTVEQCSSEHFTDPNWLSSRNLRCQFNGYL